MLSMTKSAADVLGDIRDQQGVPEDFVLRVYPVPNASGLEIDMAFRPKSAEGDQVVETAGTTLSVDPEVAEPLADTIIDTEQTPQGPMLILRR